VKRLPFRSSRRIYLSRYPA